MNKSSLITLKYFLLIQTYLFGLVGKTSYSKYSAWNHYPVTQAPCDGRFSMVADRVTHSALGAVNNLKRKTLQYGFTKNDAKSLIPLARSWNVAPKIIELKEGIFRIRQGSKGLSVAKYDQFHLY